MTRRFPLPARCSFASIDRTAGSRWGVALPSRLQRRGDLRAVQVDVDPIGGYDQLLDNASDEASRLDWRRGKPALGERACIAQTRIEGMGIKMKRFEGIPNVSPGCKKRAQAIEHEPFYIARRDTFRLVFANDRAPAAMPRRSSGIACLSSWHGSVSSYCRRYR
jgi:hypothetical protein